MTGESRAHDRGQPACRTRIRCPRLWISVDNAVQVAKPAVHRAERRLSTIHRPYYYDNQEFQTRMLSRRTEVKFRCERDTLAEAVATAQRTVASRSGALPVLQDLRITATGDGLELVGSDLEITNRVQVPAEVEETGRRGRPEAARRDRAQARTRSGDGRGHRRRSGDHRRPVLDVVAVEAGRGLPAARRRTTARACGSTRPAFAAALRQVVRAASKDDLRPILTGVLLTAHARRPAARRDRLVPARGPRPQGREHARGGPAGAGRGQGSRRGAAARRRRRDRSRAARARRRVPHVARRGHRPADRGRLPELRAAHPERLPEPADRAARGAASTRSIACRSSGRTATTPRCGSR